MKIEKICSKQDLVSNLKKAARYSGISHLSDLAEYVQAELELENLKDNICIQHYEVKMNKGVYQILKLTSKYNSEKNVWEQLQSEVIEEIQIEKS